MKKTNKNYQRLSIFFLMILGMFIVSCKNPLNLKHNSKDAKKAYIRISTNLSDSKVRSALPESFYDSEKEDTKSGLIWELSGEESNGSEYEKIWEDDSTTNNTAYKQMLGDTSIELDVGTWTFTLTAYVKNSDGIQEKVLESTIQKTIVSGQNSLSFEMEEAVGDEGVANGEISFTLNFPQNKIDNLAITLYKYPAQDGKYIPLGNQSNQEISDEVSYTYGYSNIEPGNYLLEIALQQETGLDLENNLPSYTTINTYTCVIHVAPGLKSVGSFNLSSLAKLYQISYKYIDGEIEVDAEFDETVTTSYNQYQTFTLPTPKRDGYAFKGWYEAADCTGTKVTSYKIPQEFDGTEIVFYAAWEEVIVEPFTLVGKGSNGDANDIAKEIADNTFEVTIPADATPSDVWQYYVEAMPTTNTSGYTFDAGYNYKLSVELKSDELNVIGIAAANTDMFFSVGKDWTTCEFTIGALNETLTKPVTIGTALSKTTEIRNLKIEKLVRDSSTKLMPSISIMIAKNGIDVYKEDYKDYPTPPKIVDFSVMDNGYHFDFNSAGVTLQMRDLDFTSNSSGLNKVSFDITSTNQDLETSLYATTNNPKINTWNGIKTSLGTIETKNLNVLFPIYEGDSNYTLGILSESNTNASIDISNLEVGVVSKDNISTAMNSNGKVFAIKTGDNWVKQNNLPISTTATLKEKNSTVVFDVLLINKFDSYPGENDGNHWDDCIRFLYSENNCSILENKLSYYKDKDTDENDRFNIKNDSNSEITCRITLKDDFTVLIEEVTDTNSDQPSSGGTGGVTEVDDSGDLELYSVNDVEWLHIKTSKGLEKYRDIINGTLANDITFSNGRTFSAATSSFVNAELKDNVEVSNWIPIGIDDKKITVFSFLGNGHTITINNIDSNYEGEYVGLFGYVGNMTETGVKISDLTVKGTLESDSAKFVGGIVGFSNGVTIENCVNFASLKGTERIGGIVGCVEKNTKNKINKCVNAGVIQIHSSYAWYGGIVAYAKGNITISDCINLKNLPSSGNANGAGIIHCEITDNYSTYEVNSCINTGSISMPGPYAIANTGIKTNSYYNSDNINSSSIADSSTFVIAKSTSELYSLTSGDLSTNWSFDESRYPLPNVEETFSQFTGSDGKTVWDEIVEEADFEYPTITNENISSIVAEWQSGGEFTYNVAEDITLSTSITIPSNSKVTFLAASNDVEITQASSGYLFKVEGELTLGGGSCEMTLVGVNGNTEKMIYSTGAVNINENVVITGSYASLGVIYLYSGTLNMAGGKITNNNSTAITLGMGGGSVTVNISGGEITYNTKDYEYYGSAIYVVNSSYYSATINIFGNANISNNTNDSGYAIKVRDTGTVLRINCSEENNNATIYDNTGVNGVGSLISMDSGELYINGEKIDTEIYTEYIGD